MLIYFLFTPVSVSTTNKASLGVILDDSLKVHLYLEINLYANIFLT